MKRPNLLPPDQMTPAERRAELCSILALGLVRLRMRECGKLSADKREISLHNSASQSGTVESLVRRTA
jgi:hypothetical protein